MIMSLPTISIGLPVYNGERYLAKSIESLLSQSFGDFELIISDNASTDRTGEICRDFAARDKRIRYYRNEVNLGAAPNYNRVFELASGRYFKWAAHDDMYAPHCIGRCLEMIETSSDVVLCYPKTVLIDETGNEIKKYDDMMDIRLSSPHERLRHILKNLWLCNAVFGLIRTDALRTTKKIGSFSSSDAILLCELCLRGQFWEIPEYLFLRRFHSDMSRQANRTEIDVAAWFDPANKGKLVLPQCRFFFEYIKAINRSPLTSREKIRCYEVLRDEWVKKYWRHMGGECKILLRHKLGRLRWS